MTRQQSYRTFASPAILLTLHLRVIEGGEQAPHPSQDGILDLARARARRAVRVVPQGTDPSVA